MARRRSPIEVREVSVEAVVWRDAQIKMREKLETAALLVVTYGAVTHEDEHQVILSHEHEYDPTFMREDQDYTKIPKGMIVKRIILGKVSLETEEDPKDGRGDAGEPVAGGEVVPARQ